MKYIIITLIAHCSLLIVNCNAQSIDSLVAEAVDNNLELKVLENEYYAALEKAPQVSELPDPEVGVGVFPLPVETRLGAQILRVGATQMFPWKGLLKGKKDLELAKAKALFERIGASALDLSYQVEQAYFQLYDIENSQSIIRRNVVILEALEQLALTKVESGKSTAADVLRVQLKIEELNQELNILETAKTKPIASINQLLNRPLQTPIVTTDSLSFAILPFDKISLAANIESNHPMLRMFELQQDISRQVIALNELNGKPSFGVGFDYMMINKRSDADPINNGRDIIQLRGTVKIPLFRKKYEAKEKEELLKIDALKYQKAEVLSRFMSAIEKAYVDYETAQLRIDLYTKQIAITQAAINILETNYSAMGNNFDELLRLEKELIDYDLKILKAIVQSHIAKSSIERFIIQ
jgi:outer membrane protein TolC